MNRPLRIAPLAVGLLLACAGTAGAETPPLPPPPDYPVPPLVDPNFFRDLAKVQSVEIYPGHEQPLIPCTSQFRKDQSLLDCRKALPGRSPEGVRKLIEFLAGFTWIRVKEGSPIDLKPEVGLGFGRDFPVLQLLLDADYEPGRDDPNATAQAVFWAQQQGSMRADIDIAHTPELKRLIKELLRVASAPPSADGPGKDPLRYVDPECDCSRGEPNEFVYYEEAPSPVDAPPPQRPRGVASGGKVVLHVEVGKSGDVCAIRVIRSVEGLTDAAVDGVKHWKFRPATSNNKPVCVWVEVPVSF